MGKKYKRKFIEARLKLLSDEKSALQECQLFADNARGLGLIQ